MPGAWGEVASGDGEALAGGVAGKWGDAGFAGDGGGALGEGEAAGAGIEEAGDVSGDVEMVVWGGAGVRDGDVEGFAGGGLLVWVFWMVGELVVWGVGGVIVGWSRWVLGRLMRVCVRVWFVVLVWAENQENDGRRGDDENAEND